MGEGLIEDADDLLQEALEISDTCAKVPTKATIHYYIGILRYCLINHLRTRNPKTALNQGLHYLLRPNQFSEKEL